MLNQIKFIAAAVVLPFVSFAAIAFSEPTHRDYENDLKFDGLSSEFSVSPGGQLGYRIPFEMPRDKSGIAPQISIYHRRDENRLGTVGLNWFLDVGTDAITRCGIAFYEGRTYETKVFDPADGDSNDRLCLRGEKLVLDSGIYGQSGAVYRSQFTSGIKITQMGDLSEKNASFKAYRKDGTVVTYGVHTLPLPRGIMQERKHAKGWRNGVGDSLVSAWYASKVADRYGNDINYYYNNGSRTTSADVARNPFIRKIQWGNGLYEVEFKHFLDYRSGSPESKHLNSTRLTEILLKVEGEFTKRYRFDYAQLDTLSRSHYYYLSRIKDCSNPSSVNCRFPTIMNTLGWNSVEQSEDASLEGVAQRGYDANFSQEPSQSFAIESDSGTHLSAEELTLFFDIDGDGDDDVFYPSNGVWQWGESDNGSVKVVNTGGARIQKSNIGGGNSGHGPAGVEVGNSVISVTPIRVHIPGSQPFGRYEKLRNAVMVVQQESGERNHSVSVLHYEPRTSTWKNESNVLSGIDFAKLLFVDINQDGINDALYPRDGYWQWQTGLEYGRFASVWKPLVYDNNVAIKYISDVQLIPVNINNDGVPDFLYTTNNAGSTKTYKSLLSSSGGVVSFYEGNELTVSNVSSFLDSDGDGVTEVVYQHSISSSTVLYLKSLHGLLERSFSANHTNGVRAYRVSADGRAIKDIRFVSPIPGQRYKSVVVASDDRWVIINKGDSRSKRDWAFFGVPYREGLLHRERYKETRFADFNGDGLLDLIMPVDGRWNVHLTAHSRRELTSVTNHLGAKISINYENSRKIDRYDDGHNFYQKIADSANVGEGLLPDNGGRVLVASHSVSDGKGGRRDTTYRYGPRMFYPDGRGSTGVRWQEVVNHDSGVHEKTWYRQDWPFIGAVEKIIRHNKDHLSENGTADCASNGGFSSAAGGTLLSCNNRTYGRFARSNGSIQTYLSSSTTLGYALESGASLKKTTETYARPDDFGNVGRVQSLLEDFTTGETWNTVTQQSFKNDSNKWLIGLPESVIVTNSGGRDGQTFVTSTKSVFDSVTGRLKLSEREPNKSGTSEYLSTQYQYDASGLLSRTITKGFDADGTELPQRVNQIHTAIVANEQGETVKRVVQTNALNQTVTIDFDLQFNQPLRTEDANGLIVTSQHNRNGRVVETQLPDGNRVTSLRRGAGSNDASGATYVLTTQATNGSYAETHYDELSRELRQVSIGLDGKRIYVDTEYDRLGRVYKTSTPYFADETPQYGVTQYDLLGRAKAFQAPDDNHLRLEYSGYQTSVFDGLNRPTVTTVNAKGQTIKVIDANGGVLQHRYDNRDQLVKTIDPLQRETDIGYDLLGRKVSSNDPDMGQWTYQYNSFGELRVQTDAKGQSTVIHYDQLGRPLQRQENDGVSQWVYDKQAGQSDANAKASRSIGQVVESSITHATAGGNQATAALGTMASLPAAPSLVRSLQYDSLGRISSDTVNIDGEDHTTTVNYNGQGRVASTIRPDGFEVHNDYNEHGYLVAIKSPIDQSDDFDQRHLADLMLSIMDLSDQADEKVQGLIQQAEDLYEKADEYEAKARAYERMSDRAANGAAALRRFANLFRGWAERSLRDAERYQRNSDYYASLAERYMGYAERYKNSRSWWRRLWANYYSWRARKYEQDARNYASLAQVHQRRSASLQRVADFYDRMADQREQSSEQALVKMRENEALALATIKIAEEKLAEAQAQKAIAENYRAQAGLINQTLEDEDFATWWRADKSDASGRPSRQIYGNGALTVHGYNPANGQLDYIHSGLTYDAPIQSLSYIYDAVNNVVERHNDAAGTSDYFDQYDALDRLRSWRHQSNDHNQAATWSYDAIGNVTHSKAGGNFRYGNNAFGRYTLLETDKSGVIRYDRNGNIEQRGTLNIAYNSFNKPVETSGPGTGGKTYKNAFHYGPNRSRYKQVETIQGDFGYAKTTLYAGAGYEKITTEENLSATVQHKHYIRVAGKIIAVHTRNQSNNDTKYFHYDALGSVETISDAQGEVVERFRYTPFGQRITTYGADDVTTRGFTGHEHIAGLGLIHMNARIYDPLLQRFLSPDSIVQAPLDGQSFNRFAYVRNNPQKYTDPSGHSWLSDTWDSVRNEIDRIGNDIESGFRSVREELDRFGRRVGAEFERLCEDGCYASASTNGEETTVGAAVGPGSLPDPEGGSTPGSAGGSAGVSVTFNSDGATYSAYVGYSGVNFGYTTGGQYSGGRLFAQGADGERYTVLPFGMRDSLVSATEGGGLASGSSGGSRVGSRYYYRFTFNREFMATFQANYPVEHALFKEYGSVIDTSNWPDGDLRHYELAWRNFASYAHVRSAEMLSRAAGSLAWDTTGPLNLLGAIGGAGASVIRNVIGGVTGAWSSSGTVSSGGGYLEIDREVTHLRLHGPQVINEQTYKEWFGVGYDQGLNSLVR